jgi:hypothetical protein
VTQAEENELHDALHTIRVANAQLAVLLTAWMKTQPFITRQDTETLDAYFDQAKALQDGVARTGKVIGRMVNRRRDIMALGTGVDAEDRENANQ